MVVIFLLTPNPSNLCHSCHSKFGDSESIIPWDDKSHHENAPNSTAIEFGEGMCCFFLGVGDVCFPNLHPPKKTKPSQSKKRNPFGKTHRPMATESSFHVLLGRCDLPRVGAEASLDWRHRGSRGRRVEAEWEGGGFSLQKNVGLLGGVRLEVSNFEVGLVHRILQDLLQPTHV